MLYAIKIGIEEFDLNKQGEIERMFTYCESKFSFEGHEWEEIKREYDYERMGELLESKGINCEEFIE